MGGITDQTCFFFFQGDVEKQGLPVGPVMDRDTVKKGSSQTGFIKCLYNYQCLNC